MGVLTAPGCCLDKEGFCLEVGDWIEVNYKNFRIALVKEIIPLRNDCLYVIMFPNMREETHTHDSLINIMANK